jgi:uncharacterized iron-regulated membrane protein
VFVNPVTGKIVGRRLWGACCFERRHLMPFIHTLHYTLYLPGRWGVWIMGTAAILWFFDCFVAIALTFPRRRPFLSRWGASFRINRNAGPGRTMLDIHRVGGLWLWLALVPLAMSGVALNLYEEVFRPVVSAVLPVTPHPTRSALAGDRIGFDAVVARGRAKAARLGWPAPGGIYHDATTGTYIVSFQRSQLDRGEGMGLSALIFDAVSGALLEEHVHGASQIGDTVLEIQFTLHSGRIAGTPGRAVICLAGLVVAALSLTGVLMWSRRRRAQARLRTA